VKHFLDSHVHPATRQRDAPTRGPAHPQVQVAAAMHHHVSEVDRPIEPSRGSGAQDQFFKALMEFHLFRGPGGRAVHGAESLTGLAHSRAQDPRWKRCHSNDRRSQAIQCGANGPKESNDVQCGLLIGQVLGCTFATSKLRLELSALRHRRL
jgi:hypothetical protein